MQQDGFADIDTRRASGARMYDYMLGGTDNYAVDRAMIEHLENAMPGTKAVARNNRRFLERVIRYLSQECGIRQFIDNGSGLPTQDNVHQIAQSIAPGSRVVYVDNDPVVVRHQKVAALAGDANTAFILCDACDVDAVLRHRDTRRLIDFSEPVGVLYLAFFHFIPDESDPWAITRRMMSQVPAGSYLALSHMVSDETEVRSLVSDLSRESMGGRSGRLRRRREVAPFFDGLELVEPGLVDTIDWRPDDRQEEQTRLWASYGGVARVTRSSA
jgi:hypothetical protein